MMYSRPYQSNTKQFPFKYQFLREKEEIKLTELLLLFEESAVEGVSRGIIKKFEAVEDLDSTATLYADDATKNPRRRGSGRGIGTRTGTVGAGVRRRGRLGL